MSSTAPQPQASMSGRPASQPPAPEGVAEGVVEGARGEGGGRARTCVGCGERIEVARAVDLVRLIVNGTGEIAVDARGSGFGRGAHVHARPECLRRAVERGLSRSAKARVQTIQTGSADPACGTAPLSVRTLAEAIQRAMDRRIEGMLIAAARAKRVAFGSDAVTGASQRGEASIIVVATDAAAAANLTAVRHAVAEGRAIAWGSKAQLGEMVRRTGAGAELAVLAVTSPSIAFALRDTARIADACAAVAAGQPIPKGPRPEGQQRGSKGTQRNQAVAAKSGNSQSAGACAPPPEGGKLGASEGAQDRAPGGQRTAPGLGQRAATPGAARALSQGARRAAGPSRSRRSHG
jgi:predicted RNA-binding protein YlxR (DUF448 family)/ribosomal protein L7Ae-like RNA K-turn-binding protein